MIKGQWYQSGSAAHTNAALYCDDLGQFTLQTSEATLLQGRLDTIHVSDRLGNIPRKLTFEDGSVFSTKENNAIDQLFKQKNKTANFIHILESKWRFAFIAVILTATFTFSFFKWGLPAISTTIAHWMPQKANEAIGKHALQFLDKILFDESILEPERQAEISQHFHDNLVPLDTSNQKINYTLHFRNWGGEEGVGIPNAFALPSGDIIVTDKFIELTANQNEMDSVLLHEMGHVVHKHSMQMIVSGSLLAVITTLTIGDASGLADLGLGLGSALISTNYSRHFESEADEYAFKNMLHAKIDPFAFSIIMRRMTEYMEKIDATFDDNNPKDSQNSGLENNDKDDEKTVFDYLSTHPSTEQRIENAKRYSDCFKKGLISCEKGAQ